MTFKELKAAVKGRFMNWGKYTAEKLENVSGIFESTTTEDIGKVLTVGDDGSPEWGEAVNPLPPVTSEDNGDVLSVVNGAWAKSPAPSSLPPVTSEDNGDVLSVVNGAWAKSPAPSSLPPYTSADKGKVLTVGEGEAQTVVVPEQTVTLANNFEHVPLSGGDVSYFIEGQSAVAIVNGDSYEVTADYIGGYIEFVGPNGTWNIRYSEADGIEFVGATSGSYTVKMYVTSIEPNSIEPKWEGRVHYLVFSNSTKTTMMQNFETLLVDAYTANDNKFHVNYYTVLNTEEDALAVSAAYEAYNSGKIVKTDTAFGNMVAVAADAEGGLLFTLPLGNYTNAYLCGASFRIGTATSSGHKIVGVMQSISIGVATT